MSKDKAAEDLSKSGNKKKTIHFYGYASVFFYLTIVAAGATWVIYEYLPQYYFPMSFLVLVVLGILAFVILSRRIVI